MVSVCVHPTSDYLISAASDGTWAFYDVAQAACVTQVGGPTWEAGRPTRAHLERFWALFLCGRACACPDVHHNVYVCLQPSGLPPSLPRQVADDAAAAGGGYSCAALHPDGLILCTGTADAAVRIWETRTQKVGGRAPLLCCPRSHDYLPGWIDPPLSAHAPACLRQRAFWSRPARHHCAHPNAFLAPPQNVAKFDGHEGRISGISFSENGCARSLPKAPRAGAQRAGAQDGHRPPALSPPPPFPAMNAILGSPPSLPAATSWPPAPPTASSCGICASLGAPLCAAVHAVLAVLAAAPHGRNPLLLLLLLLFGHVCMRTRGSCAGAAAPSGAPPSPPSLGWPLSFLLPTPLWC